MRSRFRRRANNPYFIEANEVSRVVREYDCVAVRKHDAMRANIAAIAYRSVGNARNKYTFR